MIKSTHATFISRGCDVKSKVVEVNTKYIKSGTHYEVAVTTDRSGRTSVIITENPYSYSRKEVVDVELPAKTGEFKDSFKPTVKVESPEILVEATFLVKVDKGLYTTRESQTRPIVKTKRGE